MSDSPGISALPAPGPAEPRLRRHKTGPAWWMLLILFLLAAGVYANSLQNEFVFDDVGIIQNNEHVANLEWTTIWTDGYWPKHGGVSPDALYRPLTLWSYLANQAILPGAAWSFHLVNVLLHGLVTVLVALLAWRLLGDRLIAIVVGVLFAVHPLHTEVVANTVGRAELLAAIWILLALLVYLPSQPLLETCDLPPRRWWHGGLVAACFFAGLLAKESPATLLLAIPLLDLWRWLHGLSGSSDGSRAKRFLRFFGGQSLRYYLPMAVVMGIYLRMRAYACGLMTPANVTSPVVNPLVTATIPERIITPFALLAKYLALLFWPVHFSADYSAPSLPPTANPLSPLAAAGILTCVLTVILLFRTWRKLPQVALILMFFAMTYALVANVIRIGTIFGERLFYTPSIFVLMLVAWGLVAGYRAVCRGAGQAHAVRTWRFAATALLLAATFLMGWRTWVRNTDWKSNLTLAISTARDNVTSGKALAWAGRIILVSDHPEYDAFAIQLVEEAIRITPEYGEAHWTLARHYAMHGDLGKSLIYLAQAARVEPGEPDTRLAMTAVLDDLKKSPPEKYMPTLLAWRDDHPKDESIYLALALAYHAQGKYDDAEANAQRAIQCVQDAPSTPRDSFFEARAELAKIHFDEGHQTQAIDEFRNYTACVWNSVDVRCEFARMLMEADAHKHPEYVKEARYNLSRADSFDAGNPLIRETRGIVERAVAALAKDTLPEHAGNAVILADPSGKERSP